MQSLRRGKYELRLTRDAADIALAQELRHLAFRQGRGLKDRVGESPRDADDYDGRADHGVIFDLESGQMLACFRMQIFQPAEIARSYAANFYDLSRLSHYPAPMLELGRFCLHPDCHDADLLRLAWAMITRQVDAAGVGLLFGCSSFAGIDISAHAPALAVLPSRIAPQHWAPLPVAQQHMALSDLPQVGANPQALPPLLRSYLQMGAWVSDHLVIDSELQTLHVFTGLEIAAIPEPRARVLRALAAEIDGV